MKCIIGNQIEIENPSRAVLDYCSTYLKLDNPDYLTKIRLGLKIYNTSSHLYLYERYGDRYFLPFGSLKAIYPLIKHNYKIVLDFAPLKAHKLVGKVDLYDYQEKAVKQLINAKFGVLNAPCGSGKTQIGIALIKELGLKALWLTHTKDLLIQSLNRAKQYFPDGDFGTITDGKIDVGNDITFATVQTMSKFANDKFENEFNVVIVDECHRCAGTPTKVSQFFKVVGSLKCSHKYGLSATVHRADGLIKSMYALLGDVVCSISDEEVKDKIVKAHIIKYDLNTFNDSEAYIDYSGMIQYQSLIKYLARNNLRNEEILNNLSKLQLRFNLVLCNTIEQCEYLQSKLQLGYVVVGKTPEHKRQEIFELTKQGNNHFIFSTYNLAKEGLDIPNLDTLHLVTPQKDFAIIKQAVGRIERAYPDKPQPVVYDYVDTNIYYCETSFKKRKTTYNKNFNKTFNKTIVI